VLTLAYCRVSTDEQAEEGFSIEGQADKLRAYSAKTAGHHLLSYSLNRCVPGLSAHETPAFKEAEAPTAENDSLSGG